MDGSQGPSVEWAGAAGPRRRDGLRVQVLLALLVLVATLPAWGIAGYTAWRFAVSERIGLVRDERSVARAAAGAIEREVAGLRASLGALATSPSLVEGDFDSFRQQATQVHGSEAVQFVLSDRNGQELLNTGADTDTPLPPAPEVASEAVSSLQVQVSPVYRDRLNQRPVVAISVPVRIAGAVRYALTATVDAARYWSLVPGRGNLPAGWRALVVDGDGTVVADPQLAGQAAGQPVPEGMSRAVLQAQSEPDWEGMVRAGSAYLVTSPVAGLPWTVVVSMPAEQVDGALERILLPLLIVGVILLAGLTTGLVRWAGLRLAVPLAALERAAVAMGQPGAAAAVFLRPPASGLREIDAVAGALAAATHERQEREAALASLAARLEVVLESTTDGVVGIDAGDRLNYANGRARALLGAAAPDRLGALFPDHPGCPFVAAFRQARTTGAPTAATGFHRGTWCWLAVEAYPAGDTLTLFFRDVSAAHRAEIRLQAVLEQVPVGVILAEADAVTLANRHAVAILGGGAADGAAWTGWHPDGRAVAPDEWPLERVLRTGEPADGEFRLRRSDGSTRWVRVWAAPIREVLRDGQHGSTQPVEAPLAGAVLAIADIEAERAGAAALRESEERFRSFAEACPDLLWVANAGGRGLEYLSPAFQRIWGESRDAALRDRGHWADTVHEADREAAVAALPRVLAGETMDIEYRIRRADGEERWIRDIGFPIRDSTGRIGRVGGFARDVTAQKNAAVAQGLLIDELNHRVKNTLAIVQSLAQLTAQSGRHSGAQRAGAGEAGQGMDSAEFVRRFGTRLRALAAAHDLLTARTWSGAALADTVVAALSAWQPAGNGSAQVAVSGPPVWLNPKQSLGLSLALHELATNATKYGALSVSTGRVTVQWNWLDARAARPQLLVLEWLERDGPPVRAPAGAGFGSRLLNRALPAELGAGSSVALRYDAPGFTAGIRFRPAGASGSPEARREGMEEANRSMAGEA